MSGKFIVIDGPEGAGKTTLLATIGKILGEGFYITSEPRGAIRELLMSRSHSPTAEMFLFLADRAEHLIAIREALTQGVHVLCDRYAPSTYAHQGWARGLHPLSIVKAHDDFLGDWHPDHYILLDIDTEAGLRRKYHSAGDVNHFDGRGLEYHNRVRRGFHCWENIYRGFTSVVDASQSSDVVAEEVLRIINTIIVQQ